MELLIQISSVSADRIFPIDAHGDAGAVDTNLVRSLIATHISTGAFQIRSSTNDHLGTQICAPDGNFIEIVGRAKIWQAGADHDVTFAC